MVHYFAIMISVWTPSTLSRVVHGCPWTTGQKPMLYCKAHHDSGRQSNHSLAELKQVKPFIKSCHLPLEKFSSISRILFVPFITRYRNHRTKNRIDVWLNKFYKFQIRWISWLDDKRLYGRPFPGKKAIQ